MATRVQPQGRTPPYAHSHAVLVQAGVNTRSHLRPTRADMPPFARFHISSHSRQYAQHPTLPHVTIGTQAHTHSPTLTCTPFHPLTAISALPIFTAAPSHLPHTRILTPVLSCRPTAYVATRIRTSTQIASYAVIDLRLRGRTPGQPTRFILPLVSAHKYVHALTRRQLRTPRMAVQSHAHSRSHPLCNVDP